MRVKLIDYPEKPLELLAKATLVSYWKDWSIDKLDQITEKDAEMHIPKVLSYGHESILEHIKLTWAVEGISRVTSHQLVRHRLASYTQRSQRYIVEDGVSFIVPESIENVRGKVEFIIPDSGNEGLEIELGEINVYENEVKPYLEQAKRLYKRLIEFGVPPEDARYILPQGIETKIVVTMNFREFKHFIGLRMCERAQWEIQELAWEMWKSLWDLGKDWQELLIWAKVGPKCISLGYCPEGELMPEGCLYRQRAWWNKIRRIGVNEE